ncbi:MAG: hypothetical protein GXO07_02035 [Crenarchaeota archaeon]|nr:hypothetical protein [Thermoproteota archaeon]
MKRVVRARRERRTKRKGDKAYESYIYVIRIALGKSFVERFGEEFEVEVNEETGEIRLKPVKGT